MKIFGNIFKKAESRTLSDEVEGAIVKVLRSNLMDDVRNSIFISEESSLSLSAVWACVRILSETTATLPIHLYKKVKSGREVQYTHPSFEVIQTPNSYLNRYDILYHLVISCTLWGNGYVRIRRNKYYQPETLELLHPRSVEPTLSKKNELFYRVDGGEMVDNCDIIHIKGVTLDGIKGKSPIAVHRDNLALTFSAQDYGEKFFSQGGNMSGVYNHPGSLKDDAYKRLKDALIERTVGLKNAHTPLLLEGGMKYERISIPPEDAQFISTRKFQKTEIATIYGVPPHMIADLERSTNNNIEHQAIEFVNYCLMPYLVKIETEFNRKLLKENEFGIFYFKFNVNALQRGDAKSRGEYYKTMFMIATLNPNEIRELEEMNTYDGGDFYYSQLNMQSVNDKENNKESQL